jgi:hypothetical protein
MFSIAEADNGQPTTTAAANVFAIRLLRCLDNFRSISSQAFQKFLNISLHIIRDSFFVNSLPHKTKKFPCVLQRI